MGLLLRTGVLLSAAIVLIAGLFYLIRYGGTSPAYGIFHGEPQELRGVPQTALFAARGHRRGWIQLGLLVLIATPIARVLFSVYTFARERDWLYVGLTVLVLAVLAYSLFWARI